MRLKTVVLQNFRCYQNEIRIPIDNLTAFIGRNDAGKSTVLEALDIFFESGTIKIDPDDASKSGECANVRIGAVFDELPDTLTLDSGSQTTLRGEHLLNTDGDLEVFKVYNCSVSGKVPKPKVFARAMHPTAADVADLLQKKVGELRALVRQAGVEENCQQNNNASMRHALYDAVDNLAACESEVPLNEADAKNVWEAIRRRLPVYALFQSDRASRAQDPEAQSPMKLAVQKALTEINADLEEITRKVEETVERTASRTLDQLKSSYPEMELASVLKPVFERPNWGSVFKLDLQSDDDIPLNKRGSGVRRLVLLSFFQAEAIRLQEERTEADDSGVPVIYAIEEPETSQHPDHQEQIISALRAISKNGDQVLVTTHVPALAGILPVSSLRFVDVDPATSLPRVRSGSDEVFAEIAHTLGVLPDPATRDGVRVAVAVEGKTDVDALVSFCQVLIESGRLEDLDQNRIFWTLGGGSTLKDWVERRYLDNLNIPQVYIFDSDRTSADLPPAPDKIAQEAAINARDNCQAFLARKRTIENYLAASAVTRLSNGQIELDNDVDSDFGNIASAFGRALHSAKKAYGHKLEFHPIDHNGCALPLRHDSSCCKKIITSYVMRNMSADEVIERGTYTGDDGQERNEILEWLEAIRAHL